MDEEDAEDDKEAEQSRDSLIARWSFTGEDATLTEEITGATTTITHRDDNPVRINGIERSLLFDGYSTWAAHPPEELDDALTADLDELTIDVWIAPRSFSDTGQLDTIVERINRDQERGFVLGADTNGAWSFQVGFSDRGEELRVDDPLLNFHEWAHLTAVFNGNEGSLELYLNGESVARQEVDSEPIASADAPLSLGRNNRTAVVEDAPIFELDLFDGAISQLELYNEALPSDLIGMKHEDESEMIPEIDYKSLTEPVRFEDDYRPEFHAIPPRHWMNEPHGPLYYNGSYHLFYQHNPKGPYWEHMHWGHWVSDDLVHWQALPEALRPELGALDSTGCWAGDAILDENEEPSLFYTVGISADSERRPDQAIAGAMAADPSDPNLIEWNKDAHDPDDLILPPPPDETLYPPNWPDTAEYPPDFRDPHIWREAEQWFCLVGSSIQDTSNGTVLLYRSAEFNEWQYEGQLMDPDDFDYEAYPFLGDVWELPVLLPLGEEGWGSNNHILCINPVGGEAAVDIYYWLGEWNAETSEFVRAHEEPRLIDYGDSHFTGPSGMVDQNPDTADRSVLFTIAQDYRLPEHHFDAGWAHNAGLPIELSLRDDGRLGIEPIEELQMLREEKRYEIADSTPSVVNSELEDITAEQVEIQLEIEVIDADQYGLRLRRTSDGDEETVLAYNEPSGTIILDRQDSSSNPELLTETEANSELIHQGDVDIGDENLELHIYIDGSMLECYVNSLNSLTTRTYPTDSAANGLQLFHTGDMIVRSMEIWDLASISDE